jgi:hypothetical protein
MTGLEGLLDAGSFSLAEAADRLPADRYGLDRRSMDPVRWSAVWPQLAGALPGTALPTRWVLRECGPDGPTPWTVSSPDGAAERVCAWAWGWIWSRAVRERSSELGVSAPWDLQTSAAVLDLPSDELRALRHGAPDVFEGLVRLARVDQPPWIHVAPALRPGHARASAEAAAVQMLDRLPDSGFSIVATDRTEALELFGPVARDLASPLATWGVREAERWPELAAALRDDPKDPDLLAWLADRAVNGEPDLEAERASQESGLSRVRWPAGGGWTGWFRASRLAAPDPRVALRVRAIREPVVLVAGPVGVPWLTWLQTLLESGRVQGLAVCVGTGLSAELPVVPDVVVGPWDAVPVDGERLAAVPGAAVHRAGAVGVHEGGAIPRPVLDVVRLATRARVLGGLPGLLGVAFGPRGPGLDPLRLGLAAVRLGVAALSPSASPGRGGARHRPSGRFRA